MVVDTNVLASGFVRPGPPPGQVMLHWRNDHFLLVTSEHILDELERTFASPYFSGQLPPADRLANLALLRPDALVTPLTVTVRGIASHPEDDLVRATAVSAHADYLVTGDRALRRLGSYESIAILTPREFVAALRDQGLFL